MVKNIDYIIQLFLCNLNFHNTESSKWNKKYLKNLCNTRSWWHKKRCHVVQFLSTIVFFLWSKHFHVEFKIQFHLAAIEWWWLDSILSNFSKCFLAFFMLIRVTADAVNKKTVVINEFDSGHGDNPTVSCLSHVRKFKRQSGLENQNIFY